MSKVSTFSVSEKNLLLHRVLHLILITSVIAFIYNFTVFMSSVYIDGDQLHYTYVYENIWQYSVDNAYYEYFRNLGTKEIPYFFLVYFFGEFVSRELFLIISNTVLALLAYRVLRIYGANSVIAALFVVTNFYLYVLYIPAERLKLSFIFLLSAIIFFQKGKAKISYLFSFLSIMTHSSVAILFVPFIINKAIPVLKRKPFYGAFFIVFLGGFLYLSWGHLLAKFTSYSSLGGSLIDVLKVFIMMIFSLLCVRYDKTKKTFTIIVFLWTAICVFVLGGSRVNMFAFFFFLYFSLQYKNGINVFVIALMIYFSYASYFFVERAILYGDAFYFAGSG